MANMNANPLVDHEPEQELTVRRYPREEIRFTENDIDPHKLLLSYDRSSDTLLVFLYGRERRSVVVAGGDYVFSLVDPETNEFVGVQIEDFLARAVKAEPRLIDLLDYAELRGMTVEDVRQERQNALGFGGRVHAWAEHELRSHRRPAELRKLDIVRALLRDERLGLPVKLSVGTA